jgi:hypothetical protein
MRASKLPFRNFEYNIRRAEASARLDGYLEDLLYNEGKRTVRAFFEIPNEIMQSLGMDRIMKKIAEVMKTELEIELQQKGKEYYEKTAKDLIKRLRPRIQKIKKMFEDLGIVMDQTLLEQALVAAVSAFEVYLRELAVSVVILNPSIRKKFKAEIDKSLDFWKLEGYKQDAKRVQGEIVAELVRLDTRVIKGLLRRLIGLENVFVDRETELDVRKIFQTRHVIIHRAGLIDPRFKKATKLDHSIDSQIKISRNYVLKSIRILRRLSQRIENYIDSKRKIRL